MPSKSRPSSSLVQSIRDTILTLDNAKTVIFYIFVYTHLTRSYRLLRANGLGRTIYDGYLIIARAVMGLVLKTPAARRKVKSELGRAEGEMIKKLNPPIAHAPPSTLPSYGLTLPQLRTALTSLADPPPSPSDSSSSSEHHTSAWRRGRVSGAVYDGGEAISSVILEAISAFVVSNPLHPDIFPGLRRLEASVIAMTVELFHGKQPAGGWEDGRRAAVDAVGSTTSGGTESILMACKSYRDWGKEVRGITEPEIVVPVSAHAAFEKAGSYFGIKIRHVDVDPETRKVDIRAVRRAINQNTVALVGSAPNFPDGIIDDIAALSRLALTHQIGLHVDCCLGSLLVPFLERAGFPSVPFDFRLEGVTSISCDLHKYGFTNKGISIIMYRDKTWRRHQYFVTTTWPGGVYASPTMAGSRPGALIAGAWATLMFMGQQGYIQTCQQIITSARRIEAAIRTSIPELYVLGKPIVSVVAFGSNTSEVDIYEVGDRMSKMGWHLNALQSPAAIHIACTRLTAVADFIADLKSAVSEARAAPPGKGDMVALYGLGSSSAIGPGLVKELACRYLDAVQGMGPGENENGIASGSQTPKTPKTPKTPRSERKALIGSGSGNGSGEEEREVNGGGKLGLSM